MFCGDRLRILSTPVLTATPGKKHTYKLKASGKGIRFTLEKGPEGMKIKDRAGLLEWNVPNGTKAQVEEVTIVATDSSGKKARQRYSIKVIHE